MSCEPEIARAVRDRGRRLTIQRTKILGALRHAGEHQSAEQVLDRVRVADPSADISVSTVYRTLETATALELTSELRGASGTSVYEWNDRAATHHHLVCSACGRTEEVEIASLLEATEEIRLRSGFAADIRHLAIPGRCSTCAAATNAGEAAHTH